MTDFFSGQVRLRKQVHGGSQAFVHDVRSDVFACRRFEQMLQTYSAQIHGLGQGGDLQSTTVPILIYNRQNSLYPLVHSIFRLTTRSIGLQPFLELPKRQGQLEMRAGSRAYTGHRTLHTAIHSGWSLLPAFRPNSGSNAVLDLRVLRITKRRDRTGPPFVCVGCCPSGGRVKLISDACI